MEILLLVMTLAIGDLSAFSGSFTQRSASDVVALSDGDLIGQDTLMGQLAIDSILN